MYNFKNKILAYISSSGNIFINFCLLLVVTRKFEQCKGQADVIIVLDRSQSVGKRDYDSLIGFCLHLARTFKGLLNIDDVRLGVASYATTASREIDLNTFGFAAFKKAVEKIKIDPTNILTNIGAGLKISEEMLDDYSKGARKGALKLVVVTTDAHANRGTDPVKIADKMKARNISFVSIGVGDELTADQREIRAIASSPKMYYYLPKFNNLNDTAFLRNVTRSVCRSKSTSSAYNDFTYIILESKIKNFRNMLITPQFNNVKQN